MESSTKRDRSEEDGRGEDGTDGHLLSNVGDSVENPTTKRSRKSARLEASKVQAVISLLQNREYEAALERFREHFPSSLAEDGDFRFEDRSLFHRLWDVVMEEEGEPILRYGAERERELFVELMMAVLEMDPTLAQTFQNEPRVLPLHRIFSTRFFHDCFDPLIKAVLEAYPEALAVPREEDGCFPLHIAAKYWKRDALQRCLALYPRAAAMQNKEGELPFEILLTREADITTELMDRFYEACPVLLDQRFRARSLPNIFPSECRLVNSVPIRSSAADLKANWILNKWPHLFSIPDKKTGSLALHLLPHSDDIGIATLRRVVELYPQARLHRNDSHGDTPFHSFLADRKRYCLEPGIQVALLLFTRESASIPSTGRYERLPLHLLMDGYHGGNEAMFEEIWQQLYRAYPDALKVQDAFGNTPLHLARSSKCALKCIQNYPDSCKMSNHDGDLPLHLIYRLGGFSYTITGVMEKLLEVYPDAANLPNQEGRLPLHMLCRRKIIETHHFDMLYRAFPDAIFHPDREGYLPIHHLMQHRGTGDKITILEHVLAVAPDCVSAVTKNGDTILHLARASSMLEWVMSKYPNFCTVPNKDGNLPLHALLENTPAYIFVDFDSFQKLVDAFPGALKSPNARNQLPIHKAAFVPSHKKIDQIVQVLVDRYPEGVLAKDDDGRLPIHSFVATCNRTTSFRRCFRTALNLLDRLHPSGTTEADKHGNNVLHLVNDYGVMEWIVKEVSDWKKLCQAQNHRGEYPIHVASSGIILRFMKRMVVNIPESLTHCDAVEGNTPLHNATSAGALLDKAPAAAKQVNNAGKLPLHLLGQARNLGQAKDEAKFDRTLRLLIESHPEGLTTFDNQGYLPVHYVVSGVSGLEHNGWIDKWLTEEQKTTLPATQDGTPLVFLAGQPDSKQHAALLTSIFQLVHRSIDYWK